MSYSEWVMNEYPYLKRASSVKVYGIIKQAKSKTAMKRDGFSILSLSLFAFLFYILVGSLNLQYYEILGWYIGVFSTVFISTICNSQFNKWIIKNELRKLISKSTAV